MTNVSLLNDPDVFVPSTDANHHALQELAGILKDAGFAVGKKVRQEATLRVYPKKWHEYPLLNPVFANGELYIRVLSDRIEDSLNDVLVSAANQIVGCEFVPVGSTGKPYCDYGYLVFALHPTADLSTLSSPLQMLHDCLIHDQSTARSGDAEPEGVQFPWRAVGLTGTEPSAYDLASDIADIQRESKTRTEAEARILARVGQGEFRAHVLAQWDGKCAVTGESVPEVVRASHIKPWRESNDGERLDPDNGLPLIATLDALFDTGLISFGKSGAVIVSPDLPQSMIARLQLNGSHLRSVPNQRTRQYLAFHRTHIFKGK